MNKILKIKVKPNSPKTCIDSTTNREDLDLNVNLKTKAEKGKANKELITFLSTHYKVSPDSVKILTGKTSKIKLVQINYL
jgi:uncharacterized protein